MAEKLSDHGQGESAHGASACEIVPEIVNAEIVDASEILPLILAEVENFKGTVVS